MKITVKKNDIYDICVDDMQVGFDGSCPYGYDNFDIKIDEVYSNDDNITIEISGTCSNYGYHSPINCKFNGILKMDSDTFTYEYTNAAEDGYKYIEFDGSTDITYNTSSNNCVDTTNISETVSDTIDNIKKLYEHSVYDESAVTEDLIQCIILEMNTDKFIKAIKQIDNEELNKDNVYEYLIENVIDQFDGCIEHEKYKEIDLILLSELKKLINNNTLNNILNDILAEYSDNSNESYDVTAKVFFSNLDL